MAELSERSCATGAGPSPAPAQPLAAGTPKVADVVKAIFSRSEEHAFSSSQ